MKFDLGVSKNNGKTTQIIHLFIGFSIIFTIHFGVPLLLETPICSHQGLFFQPWQFADTLALLYCMGSLKDTYLGGIKPAANAYVNFVEVSLKQKIVHEMHEVWVGFIALGILAHLLRIIS